MAASNAFWDECFWLPYVESRFSRYLRHRQTQINVIDLLRKRCYNREENAFDTGFLGGDLIGYLENEIKASQRI